MAQVIRPSLNFEVKMDMNQGVLPWVVGLLVLVNAWELQTLYTMNREIGRLTSDSDSEKATRARVNREILRRLRVPEEDIAAAVDTDPQLKHVPKTPKPHMKRFLLCLMAVAIVVLFSGCGTLLPKRVEFFQDKVAKFPEQKASEKEVQRQAAQRAHEKANETVNAAVAAQADLSVIRPAVETEVLTDAVSDSLGSPLHPANPEKTSEKLATELRTSVAKLNARIDNFKADNNENAGKKIENTGVFKVGYFSMWAIILGGLLLLWGALKIYGMINPVVGIGTNVVGRVSSTVLKKGLSEITEGGEWFKNYLKESNLTADAKQAVLEIFRRSQIEAQSRDTQKLISRLTEES